LPEPLVECREVSKYFPVKGLLRDVGNVRAVERLSLTIHEHKTYGLVGESGCGKTTLARTIMRLIPPTAGEIYFEGRNILTFGKDELKEFRRETSIVFQDPYTSLDPRMIIADVVGEPLSIHGVAYGENRENMVLSLLEKVGLKPEHMYRYPHEFSGGQRQRIAIARALAGDPKFILLDEASSALDVSVQAKILNLLNRLKENLALTYLFISHNLSVIRHISDEIGVMYLGELVEQGSREQVFDSPLHPYTQGILAASPKLDPDKRTRSEKVVLKGEIPSAINPPSGCRFHTRCPIAIPLCSQEMPAFRDMGEGHMVSCHRV
jgi:oligopeptide/dipeptide ABC transporter ATP-binding protein